MEMHGNISTKEDQCQYGPMVEDPLGKALARKPTKSFTNPLRIALQLRLDRDGAHTHRKRQHGSLSSGVAKIAQVYPPASCEATWCGLKEQVDLERRGQFLLLERSAPDLKEACGSTHSPVPKWLGILSIQGKTQPTACDDDDGRFTRA